MPLAAWKLFQNYARNRKVAGLCDIRWVLKPRLRQNELPARIGIDVDNRDRITQLGLLFADAVVGDHFDIISAHPVEVDRKAAMAAVSQIETPDQARKRVDAGAPAPAHYVPTSPVNIAIEKQASVANPYK